MGNNKTDNKIDNRKIILESALELFSKRQYEAVGVQEIVSISNITKPTLYYYFGNKKGLFEAIIKEYGDNLIEKLKRVESYNENLTGSLKRIAEIYFNLTKNNNKFARMLLNYFNSISDESEIKDITFKFYFETFSLVENIFNKESKNNGNMVGREKIYAMTFIGMLFTYMTLIINGLVEVDDRLIFDAVRQFLYGI